jgi:hypothetical protein
MNLVRAFIVNSDDRAQFAWANLRRYHNVDFVEDTLCRLHNIPRTQRENAKKQASQIRYCLIQAKEYFDAAERVSLATKPTLSYYCIMTLALAEILFKQSGESSLDKAREQHRHHGLTLRMDRVPGHTMNVRDATSCLAATPLMKGSDRTGTFDLWHRSAREMPMVAEVGRVHGPGASFTSYELGFEAADTRLALVPQAGLTLFDCLHHLPCMVQHLGINGVQSNIVRGRLFQQFQDDRVTYRILLHPSTQLIFDKFCDNIIFHPDCVDRVNFNSAMAAGEISWVSTGEHQVRVTIPSGVMLNRDEIHFWPEATSLNEFGFFYAALFILGNYARYYPDQWMVDVDRASSLALATERLLSGFAAPAPLLTLSELERTYFVAPP